MKEKRVLFIAVIISLAIGVISGYYAFHRDFAPAAYPASAYFSPEGRVEDHIIKAIDDTRSTIDIAIFNLTSRNIAGALEKAKERGVKIRIIADSGQEEGERSLVYSLRSRGCDIKSIHGKKKGIMHNKFAILDKKVLVTGSYNWTYSAEHFNYENAVFISDPNVIKSYQDEFDKIW